MIASFLYNMEEYFKSWLLERKRALILLTEVRLVAAAAAEAAGAGNKQLSKHPALPINRRRIIFVQRQGLSPCSLPPIYRSSLLLMFRK